MTLGQVGAVGERPGERPRRSVGLPALALAEGNVGWPQILRDARALPKMQCRIIVADEVQRAVTALVGAALGRGAVMLLSPKWPAARRNEAVESVESVALPPGAATVIFTSGSTGAPKAIVHTVRNHIHSAAGAHARVPFAPPHNWLLSLPLWHIGGAALVYRALMFRATLSAPRNGERISAAMMRTGCTHMSLVAQQLAEVLNNGVPYTGEILVGGGPVPQHLMYQARAAGLRVRQTWGMTETCAQVSTARLGENGEALDAGTAGPPLPGRAVCVQNGRLYVKGPTIAPLQIADGMKSRLTDEDGWFNTEDRGHIDAHGRIIITGRGDLRFISGGENIAPEEIEAVLHRRVERAAVVDVADAKWGRRPVAFVAPFVERADLTPILAQHLPRFMWPDAVWPWPEDVAPLGELKVDRAALKLRATKLRATTPRGDTL